MNIQRQLVIGCVWCICLTVSAQVLTNELRLTIAGVPSTDDVFTLIYHPSSGLMAFDSGERTVTVVGLTSASGWFDRDGVTTPVFCHGLFDICTPHRLFNLWPEGFQNLVIGPALPTGLTPEQLVEDIQIEGAFGTHPDQWGSIDAYVPTSPHLFVESRIGLMRWDNSVVVAEWPSSRPGPMMQLDHRQLEFVDLANADLSGSTFADSDLSHARFSGSVVADVDFQGAQIDHGEFDSVSGLTAEQLYSTSSYQTKHMAGIRFPRLRMPELDLHQQDLSDAVLDQSILTNANFSEARLTGASLVRINLENANLFRTDHSHASLQDSVLTRANLQEAVLENANLNGTNLTDANLTYANLTDAQLRQSTLKGADLAGARIDRADLYETTARGFTKEQLYSTRNYLEQNLQGIGFESNHLANWNFAVQDLSNATLTGSTLVDAQFSHAIVTGADFADTTSRGFEKEQLYSTDSYAARNLQGIGLAQNDLSGWDFADHDLTKAQFYGSNLAGAEFFGTNLTGTNLNQARLTDANFNGAVVAGASFGQTTSRGFTKEQLYSTISYQQKDLSGIDLGGNNLSGWNFPEQNLTAAWLIQATLSDTDLTDANLTDAVLAFSTFRNANLTRANLDGAYFEYARLFDTIFTEANLSNGHFSEAQISNADFTDALLIAADFAREPSEAARIRTAKFQGTNLSNANLNHTNLDLAEFDSTTVYNQWTLFPEDFDPVERGLTRVASPAGDFDANGVLDAVDLDLLADKLRNYYRHEWLQDMYDANQDSYVSSDDLHVWVKDLKSTWFGDVNLDGEFNSSDLVNAFIAGQYEDGIDRNSSWSTGDWNGDLEFTSEDLIWAFRDNGYDAGARVRFHTVAEPARSLLVGAIILSFSILRRVTVSFTPSGNDRGNSV